MKYLLLTIIFLLILVIIYIGFTVYNSYNLWNNNKREIIERLYNLKSLLKEQSVVSLSPNLERSNNTVIYDKNLKVIGEFSSGKRKIVPFNQIPPLLVKILILTEDKRFYTHEGFDPRSIFAALIEDIKTMSFTRGGSTITQQLAKVLFTDSAKTLKRKLFELFCSMEIEKKFKKDEIINLYLNSIYFGHSNYGIEDAAKFYFNKDIFDLNLFEASLLISIIPNPTHYSPLLHIGRAKKKQKIVLNRLVSNGYVDSERILKGFDDFWTMFQRTEHKPNVSSWSMELNKSPYFVEYVRQNLVKLFGQDMVKKGGLTIYTSLDLEKQMVAEQVLKEGLEVQRKAEVDPNNKDADIEGAIVAMNPKNGYILAMVGGSVFAFENQFNRVVNAKRQIGSAFKPFVYAQAIESGKYSTKTKFIDKPIEYKTQNGIWRPSNYNNIYYGEVTLEFALKKSLNSVAVQLAQEVGLEKVTKIIGRALDLNQDEIKKRFKPYPSLALGVYSFSPLEVVRAYSIFPNQGEITFPISILWVKDKNGNVILDNERSIKKLKVSYDLNNNLRIIKEQTAATVNSMLGEVLKKGGTAYKAIISSGLTVDASGKTGTTNNYTDAWFIGYTKNLISAVWIGYDDPAYSLGEGKSGGRVAAPIWANFMKRAIWRD